MDRLLLELFTLKLPLTPTISALMLPYSMAKGVVVVGGKMFQTPLWKPPELFNSQHSSMT